MEDRIRTTIRILNEALVYRDRLSELGGETQAMVELHAREIKVIEAQALVEQQRKELAQDRLAFVQQEKVPALERWGLAWRDAYQAAQVPKRKAYCLWLCKRAKQLPPPPVGMEPPG